MQEEKMAKEEETEEKEELDLPFLSAFLGFLPQICRLVLRIKSVVFMRSCLEPHSYFAGVAPWVQCRVLAPWYRGQECRTCSGECGPVPHGQSSVCDSFRRYTGGRAVGSDQCVV